MSFSFRCGIAALGCALFALICSCEKHHVSELPEHAESGGETHAQQQKSHGDSGASTSPVAVTPTPAEFFPKK